MHTLCLNSFCIILCSFILIKQKTFCFDTNSNKVVDVDIVKEIESSSFSIHEMIRWNEIRAGRCYDLNTLTAAMILMNEKKTTYDLMWPIESFDLEMNVFKKTGGYDIKITGTGGDQKKYNYEKNIDFETLLSITYEYKQLRSDYQTVIKQCLIIPPDRPKQVFWITKDDLQNLPIENRTFENDVSRYEVWKDLTKRACASNITRCIVLQKLKSCYIVQNFNEEKRQINVHAVYDTEFKCGDIIKQKPGQCLMKYSKYGIFRDLAESLLLPVEYSNIACAQRIVTQRFFYDGECNISIDKSERITIKLKTSNNMMSKICFSIFVDNEIIREGIIEKDTSLNIVYQPQNHVAKFKIYCGSSVYERELHMNMYARCLSLVQKFKLGEDVAKHICRFINAYKVALLCAFVIFLFILIIKCGCIFIFLPVYIIVTILLVVCQLIMKRRNKVCQRCASTLYWGDPHLTCRMACAYCGQFASSDYNDLYAHKKDCENIHLKISPVIIFRTIIRSRFLINCMNFGIACFMIWILSNMFTVEGHKITLERNLTTISSHSQESNNSDIKYIVLLLCLLTLGKCALITVACVTKRRQEIDREQLKENNTTEMVSLNTDDGSVYKSCTYKTNFNKSAYMLLVICSILSATYSEQLNLKSIDLPSVGKVTNIRGGDIFNLPNVRTLSLPNYVGGNHDAASGMLNAVSRLSKALDGEYDEYENDDIDQIEDLNTQVDHILAKLQVAAERLETKVKDGKKNEQSMRAMSHNIKQAEQKLVSSMDNYQQRISSAVSTTADRLDELEKKIRDVYNQIAMQNNSASPELLNLYNGLQQRRTALLHNQKTRRPTSRGRNRRHIETEELDNSEEKVILKSISAIDAVDHHKEYVTSRHNRLEKSINHADPLHASRLMPMNTDCKSQGLFVHTIEKENGNQIGTIKIAADIDLTPNMCSIFSVTTDDSNVLPVQLIVKVTQTRIEWPVTYLYSTYKTDDISIVSQEWCVSGSQYCRHQIAKDEQHFLKSGGIIISWDHCQNWGCDFPGCGTAVSGSCCIICRDTYLPETEIRVYKLGKPRFIFELCYQYPGDSKCLSTSSTMGRPTKSFSFSSSFNELESNLKENENVAVNHHGKIMTGKICDPSSYCDDFGSMQVINGVIHGKDGHSADYICHGIGWKTYEVRSCFKNTWNLHTILNSLDSHKYKLHETSSGTIITEKNIYLGKASWSFEMKGVHLTEVKSNVECEATLVGCSGCWSCLEHAVCVISIDSNLDFAASLYCENALIAQNHIGVKAGKELYHTVINFDKREPKPACYIYSGDKTFNIKVESNIVLKDNNITWLDDDPVPWHKNPTEANSMFWSWNLFNPFNFTGWYSWRAVIKSILMALILLACIAATVVIVKYFKYFGSLMQELLLDLKISTRDRKKGEQLLSLADQYITREYEKKRQRRYEQLEDNKRRGLHKFE